MSSGLGGLDKMGKVLTAGQLVATDIQGLSSNREDPSVHSGVYLFPLSAQELTPLPQPAHWYTL